MNRYLLLILFYLCVKISIASTILPSSDLPVLQIGNISQPRTKVNSLCRVYLSLDRVAEKPVSIKYKTVAGTAKPKKDFVSISKVLVIPIGQQQGYFEITVIGDSLRQQNLQFTIELRKPKNCVLETSSAIVTINNANGSYLPTNNNGYTTPISYSGKRLVWSDEFNGNSLDTSSWNLEKGGGGWGNKELQYYTGRPENVFVSNGNLVIEARKENIGANQFTSARMTTKWKHEFQYGRVDIRAKLPVAKGLWPALWMLGSNISTMKWPVCGEIDIMELIGTHPSRVYSTMHFANSANKHAQHGGNFDLSGEDFSEAFHVYSMVWKKDSMMFYVDDHLFFTHSKNDPTISGYPYNAPFYFIFNLAVGGQWPGSPDDTTIFPQRMFVDYIRVFDN